MRQVVMYGPGDVRVEDREDPKIIEPTDAIIRLSATCICGSDLWPYRGAEPVDHQVDGPRVRRRRRGGRLRGPHRQGRRLRRRLLLGLRQHLRDLPGRLPGLLRAPRADGRPSAPSPSWPASRSPTAPWSPPRACPDADLIPSLMAASDVLGTGWFAAVAAEAGPGKTVAVVGDGAVGLLGILAAKQLGAERIIAVQPPRRPPGAGPRVRRHRHRRGARRRRRRQGQGAHRRARRPLGHRGRRHPGGHDAGHPLHPARRARRASSASPTTSRSPATSCSWPASTSTAAPPRSGSTCPS